MGHPMVPKITIAVAAMLRLRPRRVSPPSSAAAAACRLRQSARQRFGPRSVAECPSDTPEVHPPASARDVEPRRERSRYAGLLPGHATRSSCSARQPLLPVFRAPMPIARLRRRSTGPVRRRAALHARRGLFRLRGDPRPRHGSCEPFECRVLYPRHHGVTTKILLAALEATGLKAAFRPRHYRFLACDNVPAAGFPGHVSPPWGVVTGRRLPAPLLESTPTP